MLTPFVKPRQVLSYLVLTIAPFFVSKVAQNGRETIQSVKVRVHLSNAHRCGVKFGNVMQRRMKIKSSKPIGDCINSSRMAMLQMS